MNIFTLSVPCSQKTAIFISYIPPPAKNKGLVVFHQQNLSDQIQRYMAQSALERIETGTRQVVCVIYILRLGFFVAQY